MSLWFFCSSGFCAMRTPGIDTFVSGSESSLPQLIDPVWPLVRNGNLEDLFLRDMVLLVYPLLYIRYYCSLLKSLGSAGSSIDSVPHVCPYLCNFYL